MYFFTIYRVRSTGTTFWQIIPTIIKLSQILMMVVVCTTRAQPSSMFLRFYNTVVLLLHVYVYTVYVSGGCTMCRKRL